MKKQDVLKFYNNRVTDVANACGVSSPSVSQWREIIPERVALKLEKITRGKLRYDERYYKKAS